MSIFFQPHSVHESPTAEVARGVYTTPQQAERGLSRPAASIEAAASNRELLGQVDAARSRPAWPPRSLLRGARGAGCVWAVRAPAAMVSGTALLYWTA